MSKAKKHTPGPWRYTGTGHTMRDKYSQPYGVTDGTQLIAGCFGDVQGGEDQAKANANLIATAPDLFQEMRRYLPVLERAESTPVMWQFLTEGTGIATTNGYRRVLAKAEGNV